MANRYPLVINNSTTLVGELETGDNLNLSSSGIFDGSSIGSAGQVLKSTGTGIQWSRAAEVYLNDTQTLKNKTLADSVIDGSQNTVTNIANASLVSNSISINGTNVPLGGSITIPDENDNTTYSVSVVDGTNASQKRLRLTAGNSGSGFQDIFLNSGYNVTITRSGNDELTVAAGMTQLRAPASSPYIEGEITFGATGGTRVSQSGQTITFDSDPFPIGGIIIWSGSTSNLPSKWALCDGGTYSGVVTPDLRARFVYGAGNGYSVGSKGGSKDAVVVGHDHDGTTNGNNRGHTHNGTTQSNNRGHDHNGTTNGNNRGHTHSGTTGSNNRNHEHSGNTGQQSANHTHTGNTNNQIGNHYHSGSAGGGGHCHNYTSVSNNRTEYGNRNDNALANTQTRTTCGGDHNHNFNTSGNIGNHYHSFSTSGISNGHSHAFNTNGANRNHEHNFNTGGESQNHTHTFNTGNQSQNHEHNFGTGGESQNHTHTFGTSFEGVAGTDKNMPPYYVLAYIMKVQ